MFLDNNSQRPLTGMVSTVGQTMYKMPSSNQCTCLFERCGIWGQGGGVTSALHWVLWEREPNRPHGKYRHVLQSTLVIIPLTRAYLGCFTPAYPSNIGLSVMETRQPSPEKALLFNRGNSDLRYIGEDCFQSFASRSCMQEKQDLCMPRGFYSKCFSVTEKDITNAHPPTHTSNRVPTALVEPVTM